MKNGKLSADQEHNVYINKVHGTEVSVISAVYGYRGKADFMVEGEYVEGGIRKSVLFVLELKTGENEYAWHELQTKIYCMFYREILELRDFPQTNFTYIEGLLFNVHNAKIYLLKPLLSDMNEVIIKRNYFVYHLNDFRNSRSLPSMIKDVKECNTCNMDRICSVSKLAYDFENGGIGDIENVISSDFLVYHNITGNDAYEQLITLLKELIT